MPRVSRWVRGPERVRRAAIIGGGFSGIAAAVALKRQGLEVTLFERSPSVGGTWLDNTYPGAEVDTPSIIYSYSYAPWRWSRTHVRQAELLQYLRAVVDDRGLRDSLRLGHEVERCEWSEEAQRWDVTFGGGQTESFEVLVSAVGFLSVPRYPDWPGLSTFSGPTQHTARWDASIELDGKRVAVVGTGSTSAQLVPELAKLGVDVTLFQREPGWILPKNVRAHTKEELDALDSPLGQRIARTLMLYRREKSQVHNASWRPDTPQNAAATKIGLDFIARVFADRPDLADAVTPRYPFGGKRPILADDFYPALLKPNVTLIPTSVASVTEAGLVDADGAEHSVDVLIFATGFHTDFRTSFDVVGRNDVKLADVWGEEPEALLGLMVPQFPNFFVMYGPNTNGGSIVTNLEAQASYVAAAVRSMNRRGASAVEVRPAAVKLFNAWLQDRLKGASFEGANNYYKSPSGRIITQWCDGAIAYAAATKLLRDVAWRFEYRRPASTVSEVGAR